MVMRISSPELYSQKKGRLTRVALLNAVSDSVDLKPFAESQSIGAGSIWVAREAAWCRCCREGRY